MKLRTIDTQREIELEANKHEITSAERIDVRPGETLEVETGLELLANKSDNARLEGKHVVGEQLYGRSYQEIRVTLFNTTDSNLEIYPGDVVAELRYTPIKIATFETKATFKEGEDVE